jgi:hypothetical protein
MSGGPDFLLSRPSTTKTWNTGHADSGYFHAQMKAEHTRERFSQTFAPLIPAQASIASGFCMGDVLTRWSDLSKRYATFGAMNTTTGNVTVVKSPTYLEVYNCPEDVIVDPLYSRARDPLTYIPIMSFNFSRGSLRWKYVQDLAAVSLRCTMTNVDLDLDSISATGPNFSTGGIITDGIVKTYNECETPYYSPYLMHCASFNFVQNIGVRISVTTPSLNVPGTVLFATGEDFSLGCPIAPVPFALEPTSEAKLRRDLKSNNNNEYSTTVGTPQTSSPQTKATRF